MLSQATQLSWLDSCVAMFRTLCNMQLRWLNTPPETATHKRNQQSCQLTLENDTLKSGTLSELSNCTEGVVQVFRCSVNRSARVLAPGTGQAARAAV